jgi:hypothetical protein
MSNAAKQHAVFVLIVLALTILAGIVVCVGRCFTASAGAATGREDPAPAVVRDGRSGAVIPMTARQ